MPIGIIRPEQLEKEVASLSKIGQVKPGDKPDRDYGAPIPLPLKKVTAEEKIIGESSRLLSETFGINDRTVRSLSNGESSKSNGAGQEARVDGELLDHTQSIRDKIEKRALNKISMALRHITSADFSRDGISLREKTGAMKDMAGVVATMTKNNAAQGGNSFANFVFIQPAQKEEHQYREVEVLDADVIG